MKPPAWAIALVLAGMTFVALLPVLRCGFINFDDQVYVTENSHVVGGLTWQNLRWAWTDKSVGYFQPLSWMSLQLDATLGGGNPFMFHWTNLLLHVLSAAVAFLVLSRMTGTIWRAALAAAIYAVHPLRVESVAWIAERKDVLSNLLAWVTIGGYVWYCRAPSPRRYLAVLVPFALGLLAKPMIVTLPFLLLLLDFWPLNRLSEKNKEFTAKARRPRRMEEGRPGELNFDHLNSETPKGEDAVPHSSRSSRLRGGLIPLIAEKLPLFLLALAAGAAALSSQHDSLAMAPWAAYPLSQRLGNILAGYGLYLWKTAFFYDLAVFYPLPHAWTLMRFVQVFAGAIALGGISILCVRQIKLRPWLGVGWLWFLGVLLPVAGIFQSGQQLMADRFSYLASVGLIIMIVWSIPLHTLEFPQWVRGVGAAAMLALLCAASWVQAGYWRDSSTLFTRAIEVTGDNWLAHDQLSIVLCHENKLDEAIEQCAIALRDNPTDAIANLNIGVALSKQKKFGQSIAFFRRSLAARPDMATSHNGLGVALQHAGDIQGAYDEFRQSAALNPEYEAAHSNLGGILAEVGLREQAIAELRLALRLSPDDKLAKLKLNAVLGMKPQEAADVR